MQLLKTIKDNDLGLNPISTSITQERKASRAIVFDKDNNAALLNATKKHYHKLPGGGVEKDEDSIQALKRECKEEIGCDVEVSHELGIIEEYRYEFELHQLSYGFIAKVLGEKGVPKLEEDEKADGFETVWLSLEDAIKTLSDEINISNYEGKFIRNRDLFFLQEAQRLLNKTV
jgi:8-oxo-dGTP pyrophosphatase MutT (NUDIX family)